MDNKEQTAPARKWTPPRGIRLIEITDRKSCYGVQYRVTGKRKTRSFASREKQIEFAKGIAGDAKQNGLAAFRLDQDEAREWRAFRAQIGAEANLDAVAACWERNHRPAAAALTVAQAVSAYTASKTAEGVSASAIAHYKPIFDRLEEEHAERDVSTIKREEIEAWMNQQDGSHHTRRTRFARVRALFNWLAETARLDRSPFVGMKPPKVPHKEVSILTLKQTRSLFTENAKNADGAPITQAQRETLGRVALEAFAGLRNDTAAQIVAAEIQPDGLRIPAAKIKTAQPQYLDGLPANLFAWLKWSKPEEWTMTRRQYAEAKADAFTRAKVPHPHNCLRHGFASYHVAAFKEPGKTSVIMCHTSLKLLWAVYRGIATEADGQKVFQIMPPILGAGRVSASAGGGQ